MEYAYLSGKDVVPITFEQYLERTRQNTRESAGTWCRVACDHVGEYFVSTVFLGMNHQWGNGPPLWFETMVFKGEGFGNEQLQERCSTWAEAEATHAKAVAMAKIGDFTESPAQAAS